MPILSPQLCRHVIASWTEFAESVETVFEDERMGRRWAVPYKKVALEYAQLTGRDAKSYRWPEVPNRQSTIPHHMVRLEIHFEVPMHFYYD